MSDIIDLPWGRTANEAFYKTFKVTPVKTEGRLIYELGDGQWNIPKLRDLLEDVLPRNSSFEDFEITHDFATIGRRTMLLDARKLSDTEGRPARILLGIQDITENLQFQTAARQTQIRYQALVEASAQIVWTTDATGAVIEDSPSWRAFTGQTFEQLKGFGWLDALHPEDRQRNTKLWQRAVAERTSVETEYRLRHVSGEWRWMAVRSVPVLNPDGSVREWVGMNNDITEHKQAEEKIRVREAFEMPRRMHGWCRCWNSWHVPSRPIPATLMAVLCWTKGTRFDDGRAKFVGRYAQALTEWEARYQPPGRFARH